MADDNEAIAQRRPRHRLRSAAGNPPHYLDAPCRRRAAADWRALLDAFAAGDEAAAERAFRRAVQAARDCVVAPWPAAAPRRPTLPILIAE